MKALVKTAQGAGNVDLLDIAEPVCGADEVKIEVKACGVCGTDIHIYNGFYPWDTGLVLGHEYSGVVVEAGKDAQGFKPGDRITGCGAGGFAKYLTCKAVSGSFLFHLPDNLSFEEGALFEPLSASTRAVFERSGVRPGDVALVTGPGVIGLGTVQALKAAGARVALAGTTIDTERLALARSLGADWTIDVQKEDAAKLLTEATQGRGLDVFIECSGAQAALKMGLRLLREEGRMVQAGLYTKPVTLDIDDLTERNIQLATSFGYTLDTWHKAIELVEQGKVNLKSLVSHKVVLSRWREAFRLCEEKVGFKILVIPD
jgi:L-iditol 2-dehydrogenase